MIEIGKLVFNSFMENTWVLYDETRECIIIDPGCSHEAEEAELLQFIESRQLKPVGVYNTHLHIDHFFGNEFVMKTWNLPMRIHPEGIHFLNTAIGFASVFGYDLKTVPKPEGELHEGDCIRFGQSVLEVIEAPGHAAGSFCFINRAQQLVLTGDVLFQGSIGRTDLPSGDFDQLMDTIKNKLFRLADDYRVLPGHGPETTIGEEKRSNPFVM